MSYVIPSHPTDGVTEFHVFFLYLDCSQNDSCLTIFLTKGKRVFYVLILYLVSLGNGYASGHISYGHDSTHRPRHTYYVTVLLFVCPYVRTTLVVVLCQHMPDPPCKYRVACNMVLYHIFGYLHKV